MASVVASISSSAHTANYDPPDATHTWGVHDMNRPNPVKITASPGQPPSDAIVLFDGTEESLGANWIDMKGGPTKWKVVDGELRCVPRSGWIQTKQKFGDCQLHIEWKAPKPGKGKGQERGNSGVFLMGRYEVRCSILTRRIRPSRQLRTRVMRMDRLARSMGRIHRL